ncbi:BolA/IbaG family iron-sulfur metabolism protein [Thermaurantiacus sp.]
MPMAADEIVRRIKAALPDSEIELVDLAGDDDHWEARVTSARFQGLSRVAQHRLVYEAIGTDMGGRLHALKLVTVARSA